MNNIYDIWFARVNVANSIKLKLYKKYTTKEIFEFNREKFLENDLKEISIDKFLDLEYRKNLSKFQAYMDKNNIFQIFYKDEKYPIRLKNISDMPTYIFAKRKYRIIKSRYGWNYWL